MKLSDKKTSEIPPESGVKIISLNKKIPEKFISVITFSLRKYWNFLLCLKYNYFQEVKSLLYFNTQYFDGIILSLEHINAVSNSPEWKREIHTVSRNIGIKGHTDRPCIQYWKQVSCNHL